MKKIKFLDNEQVIGECPGNVVITSMGAYALAESPEFTEVNFTVEVTSDYLDHMTPVMRNLDLEELRLILRTLLETDVHSQHLKHNDLVFVDEEERIRIYPNEITLSDLLCGQIWKVVK